MQTGKVDVAEQLFKQVIERQPKHIAALNIFSIFLTRLERYQEAEHYVRLALNEDATSDASFYNYGVILKALKRPLDALRQFNRALQINPSVAETWNNRGTVFNDLKRYREAIADFDRAIAANANYSDAFFNKGNALAELKSHEESLIAYDMALALKRDLAGAWVGRGNALTELERNDEASAAYDKAVALKPDLAEAWLGRGNLFAGIKRYDDALAAYDRALALKPDLAKVWLGCGNIATALKQSDKAFSAFDKALALQPDLAEAWLGRGNVLYEIEQYDDAVAAHDKALALESDQPKAWLGRGNALAKLKQFDKAFADLDNALALDPDLADAWLARGNVLREVRRYDKSLIAYDKALALNSYLAEAWIGRGSHYFDQRRYMDALVFYDKALAFSPDLAEGWLGRGRVLVKINQRDDGLAAIDRALALKPHFADAWLSRANALLETNRLLEALAAYDKALAIRPHFSEAISAQIFALDFAKDTGFEEQQKARKIWWQKVGSMIAERSQIHHLNSRDPDRRIKLGYVSGDFFGHSAALCLRPMLLNHDKAQFEITCYSSTEKEDQSTEIFRRAADEWRDITQFSDDKLSQQIQTDQIDILVDLSGHTAGHRLEVFARKPAPVQVTAGATGTGLPTFDYLFSDPVICPPSVRHLFAEKVFDLPSIMTIESLPDQLRPSDPPVLSTGNVTFGVFNRASKISDDVVSLWARILESVPRSKIIMKHYAFDEVSVRNRLLERFAMHGISANRIAFLGTTSRQEHLAAFKDVDISLDPFPHNGGISTLESLQMGVPVVAILGNSVSSRAAGAILTAVGLHDWVSRSADEYLDIAVKFATMPDGLKSLRYELPIRVVASAVGNATIYTRAIEAAYRRMWVEYCQVDAS